MDKTIKVNIIYSGVKSVHIHMMPNFHILLFNETVHDNYPGVSRGKGLDEMPVWMEFSVGDLLGREGLEDMPFTPFLCREKSDLFSLIALLENRINTRSLILRRAGNAVCADWERVSRLIRRTRGITKVQIGSVPSDVYIMERENFVRLVRRRLRRDRGAALDFTDELFDRFLFHNFERIVRIPGRSFLFRNISEYFRENLRLREYFLDTAFLEFYSGLNNSHTRGAAIAEGGTVKNSMVGSGSRIEGYVEDSLIFHDVRIAPGASVRGSVILPFNTVDEGTQVANTIVLEGNGRTIGRESSIGRFSNVANSAFSNVLKKGLTVIGEGVDIPEFSRVGSGCLVRGSCKSALGIEDGMTFNGM